MIKFHITFINYISFLPFLAILMLSQDRDSGILYFNWFAVLIISIVLVISIVWVGKILSNKSKDANGEFLEYEELTLLLPSSTWNYFFAIFGLVWLIFFTDEISNQYSFILPLIGGYWSNNLLKNPFLELFGYKLYQVKTKNLNGIILLSKIELRHNNTINKIKVTSIEQCKIKVDE